MIRSALLSILVVVLGSASIYFGSSGGQAWTAESARFLSIKNAMPLLPNYSLETQEGRSISWNEFADKIVLVDFIFTRCDSICINLGYQFHLLQQKIVDSGLQDQYAMLSISFDPSYDSPMQLQNYLDAYDADLNLWQAATLRDNLELNALLKQLGVVVIPDTQLGFIHNTAVYAIHRGQVINIWEYNKVKLDNSDIGR